MTKTIQQAIQIIAVDNGYFTVHGKLPKIDLSAETASAVTAALDKLTADQMAELLTGDVESASADLVAQGVLTAAEVAVIDDFANQVFETLD